MSLVHLFFSIGGAVTDVLKYVSKPLFSKADCEKTGNAGYLDNTMICAGDDEKDACQVGSLSILLSELEATCVCY